MATTHEVPQGGAKGCGPGALHAHVPLCACCWAHRREQVCRDRAAQRRVVVQVPARHSGSRRGGVCPTGRQMQEWAMRCSGGQPSAWACAAGPLREQALKQRTACAQPAAHSEVRLGNDVFRDQEAGMEPAPGGQIGQRKLRSTKSPVGKKRPCLRTLDPAPCCSDKCLPNPQPHPQLTVSAESAPAGGTATHPGGSCCPAAAQTASGSPHG